MSPEIFAQWLHRQGYQVIHTASSYWYDMGPHVYQAFPYHWIIDPTEEELSEFLHHHRAVGLRFSTPLTTTQGLLSYHVVYDQPPYDLDNLPKKTRHDVLKGLEHGRVEQIPFSLLATEGWKLQLDTLTRQGRMKAENQNTWTRRCLSASELPGFEAWGLFYQGELVASLIAFTCDDCCSILYQQSATSCLKNGINNALTYCFAHEVLRRPNVKWIFYGLHSLDAPATVDKYKFRMGFRARPVRQRVVFHSWLAPLLGPATHSAIRLLTFLIPHNSSLTKAEGMMRFYLEGRLPLDEQLQSKAVSDYHTET